jgi:chemotaxis protein MotB
MHMFERSGRVLCGLVVGGVLLSLAGTLSGCSGGDALVTDKNTEITRLTGRVSQLEAELGTLKGAAETERQRAAALEADLQKALAELEAEQKLKVDGNRIVMPNAVLFASGSADVTPDGRKVLTAVAKALESHPDREIFVEGHTDNVPIGAALKEQYRSNWELSSARAASIILYLRAKGVHGSRLSAVGYAAQRPIATNDSEAGRAKNRRAVVVVGATMPRK